MRHDQFDEIFPTLVRYIGLVLVVVCTGFALAGHYVEAAAGLPAAVGMLTYKTLHNARKNGE